MKAFLEELGNLTRMFLRSLWRKVINAWYALQITHCGGKYSIERALVLEAFTRQTTLTRVVLLILAPPLVTITVVLCQETIPLQDPVAGWRANYGFWPRVGVLGAVLGFVLTSLFDPWLDVPPLSPRQRITYCTCAGVAWVAVGMITSEMWVFPVPFSFISLVIPMSWIYLLLLCAVMGARAIRRILTRRDQLRRLAHVAGLLGVMCVGYPAFQMLFNKANRTVYEVPVLLLLPAFKILMKGFFAHFASHKWDILPGEIVFTVEFFDALYLATCMPSLSVASLAVIVIVDLAQTLVDLLELHQRTLSILARLRTAANIPDDGDNRSLLCALRVLCYSETLQHQKIAGIQVRSCVPHQLSDEDWVLLEKLEKSSSTWMSGGLFRYSSSRIYPPSQVLAFVTIPGRARSTIAVQPHPPVMLATKPPGVGDLARECAKVVQEHITPVVDCSGLLQEALGVLFTSECLVLAEYLEIIVPVLYGTFVLAMVHLPSAQYHTEMMGVTHDNVHNIVSRMFIYALLELLSFVLLAKVMKRNCGIDPVYQLAFVVETQGHLILPKLMVWMMFTLTYRVAHFGADFSFRFDWIMKTCEGLSCS